MTTEQRTPEDVARSVADVTGWNPDKEAAEREWTAVGMGPVGQHRDSDCLARSNFTVVYQDLSARFGESVDIARFGHWAVGWVEEIIFDVGNEDCERAVSAWQEKLDNYPVANEDHFSELEWEEMRDYLDSEISSVYRGMDAIPLTDAGFEQMSRIACDYVTESASSVDQVGDVTDAVLDAYCAVLASEWEMLPEQTTLV